MAETETISDAGKAVKAEAIVEEVKEKHAGGRPSSYREIYTEQAYKLSLLGAIDKELAGFFGVSETTINNWKLQFPEFLESLKRGKIQADAEVAEKLFHRAKGYFHPETRVFCHEGKITTHEITKHYPPDTGAAMAWLKNRNRRNWCESYDITSGGEKIIPQIISFSELAAAAELKQLPEPTEPANEHPE